MERKLDDKTTHISNNALPPTLAMRITFHLLFFSDNKSAIMEDKRKLQKKIQNI